MVLDDGQEHAQVARGRLTQRDELVQASSLATVQGFPGSLAITSSAQGGVRRSRFDAVPNLFFHQPAHSSTRARTASMSASNCLYNVFAGHAFSPSVTALAPLMCLTCGDRSRIIGMSLLVFMTTR